MFVSTWFLGGYRNDTFKLVAASEDLSLNAVLCENGGWHVKQFNSYSKCKSFEKVLNRIRFLGEGRNTN